MKTNDKINYDHEIISGPYKGKCFIYSKIKEEDNQVYIRHEKFGAFWQDKNTVIKIS